MDPLSITVSVATLLGCCISVGVSLRKFLIGAAEVKLVITAMMADLRALRSVLESMEVTFEEMNSDKPRTGHIGAHWTNLSQSLTDCQQSLDGLQQVLEGVNKDVKFLDSARKQIRIKDVADKIVLCRQEVQAYRDALQLSLQTIILWNTQTVQGTADEILLTSKATHLDLQQLATNVEVKLTALQMFFERSHETSGTTKITNLKRTVTSAATVIAGGSTDIADLEDVNDLMSEIGDWFRSEAPQNTLNWITDKSGDTLSVFGGPNTDILAQRSGPANTAVRTLPVHTRLGSNPTIAIGLDFDSPSTDGLSPSRSNELTNLSSTTLESVASTPFSLAPRGVPQRKPVAGTSPSALDRAPLPQDGGDQRVDERADTIPMPSSPPPPPPPQPTPSLREEPQDSTPKRSRKRFRWLRFKNTIDTVVVLSPMMDDQPSRTSRWRKPKLPRKLKVVLIGDGASGKTCLLITITKGTFPEVYVPTVFENYVADYELNKQHFTVHFWDTAGQEDYDRLRPLSYADADAMVITFAIDSPDSLCNVVEKWISEALHFSSASPIYLVGCKKDLRHDPRTIKELERTSQKPVTPSEAEVVRKGIGAVAYLETSAKTGEGAYQALSTILHGTVKVGIDTARRRQDRRNMNQFHGRMKEIDDKWEEKKREVEAGT